MSNDSYVEESSRGWFSRIGDSIKGILFGLLLFIVAFPLLWWNEGRSVERYKSLEEGQGVVISVAATAADPVNNGKLVHTQGLAETDEMLTDDIFGVSANAIKLQRQVSMYQWQEDVKTETKEKVGGTETTKKTYTYQKEWSSDFINSGKFKRSGHDNPPMPFQSKSLAAKQVLLGAFKLNASQINQIGGATELTIDNATPPAELNGKIVSETGNVFYLGDNSGNPQIGDLKVSFTTVNPQDISVVAQQQGNSFSPYQTETGGTIDLLESGLVDAKSMFAIAQQENTLLTWAIRAGGFFMMWLGLSLIFKPLSVLAAVLPFLGNLVAMGTGILALLISLPCTMITVALAWIAYRPLLAGALIAIAAVAIIAMKFMPRRNLAPQYS